MTSLSRIVISAVVDDQSWLSRVWTLCFSHFILYCRTRSFLTASPADDAAVLLAVRTVDRNQI